jgi:hypothetical protein
VAHMQRARRVAFAAVLAVVGVAALAGCRSQPTVAAYLGDQKITEARVQHIIDEVKGELPAGQLGAYRQMVVSWILVGDLANRINHERGYTVEPVEAEARAGEADPKIPVHVGNNTDLTEMAKVYGDWFAALDTLIQKVKPAPLSDADKHAIFDQAVASGRLQPGITYDQVVDQIDQPEYGPVVGLRNELREAAKGMHISINPRYRPLSLTLGPVELPLATGDDAL